MEKGIEHFSAVFSLSKTLYFLARFLTAGDIYILRAAWRKQSCGEGERKEGFRNLSCPFCALNHAPQIPLKKLKVTEGEKAQMAEHLLGLQKVLSSIPHHLQLTGTGSISLPEALESQCQYE